LSMIVWVMVMWMLMIVMLVRVNMSMLYTRSKILQQLLQEEAAQYKQTDQLGADRLMV